MVEYFHKRLQDSAKEENDMIKECKYIPVPETERLILGQLRPEDAEDLGKWLGREMPM